MKFIKYIFDDIYCKECKCQTVWNESKEGNFTIHCPNNFGCSNYDVKYKMPIELVEVDLEKA